MALGIKNAEAECLARQLATATGESVTRAVSMAVREGLERVEARGTSRPQLGERRAWLRSPKTRATGREPYRKRSSR